MSFGKDEGSRKSAERECLSRGELKLNTCLEDFAPDRYLDLLEPKLATADHSLENFGTELYSSVGANSSLFADEETSFICNPHLLEDESAQSRNPWVIVR